MCAGCSPPSLGNAVDRHARPRRAREQSAGDRRAVILSWSRRRRARPESDGRPRSAAVSTSRWPLSEQKCGNVDDGQRIGGFEPEPAARLHRGQPLLRLEHGQGAVQPLEIIDRGARRRSCFAQNFQKGFFCCACAVSTGWRYGCLSRKQLGILRQPAGVPRRLSWPALQQVRPGPRQPGRRCDSGSFRCGAAAARTRFQKDDLWAACASAWPPLGPAVGQRAAFPAGSGSERALPRPSASRAPSRRSWRVVRAVDRGRHGAGRDLLRRRLGHQLLELGDLHDLAGGKRCASRRVGDAGPCVPGDDRLALGLRRVVPGHAVELLHGLRVVGLIRLVVGAKGGRQGRRGRHRRAGAGRIEVSAVVCTWLKT